MLTLVPLHHDAVFLGFLCHVSLGYWKPTVTQLGTQGGLSFVLGSEEPQGCVTWAAIATVFSWLLSLLTALQCNSSSSCIDVSTRFQLLSSSLQQPLLLPQVGAGSLAWKQMNCFRVQVAPFPE